MSNNQAKEHLEELDEFDTANFAVNFVDDSDEDEELDKIINANKKANNLNKSQQAEEITQAEPLENKSSVEEKTEKIENLAKGIEDNETVEKLTQDTQAVDDELEEESEPEEKEKSGFKLTLPAKLEELQQKICAKRGRKLIYNPSEVLFEKTFQIIGLDKKNDEGISVKEIIDAEIKEGLRLGYLDKFDGLKTSEIKEEYENDVVFELADQEFRKMGVILEGETVKVYVYDWDKKGLHHIGELSSNEANELLPFLKESEKYSFDICGIITGGKAKRVEKDEKGKIKVTKEKGEPLGVELDVTVINRKD